MPPLTKERNYTNDTGRDAAASSLNRPTHLSGWAGIEEHFMKHDTSMMKDYADDIDTLLVFAALFSAILTTFVVQTYQLLQPGDSGVTNQLIAYQIFSQGNHDNIPSTVNATLSSLLATPAFAPSASARWINVFFFFSLVLSLAAALLGIMVKQWIREYMKWNAPLATPRENIMLRQIRFEDWETWNVEAFIWSIPSMLELAMIFFLVGVVILLWTLDNVTAIAITVLVASFLGFVAVITIIPIFVKHCPYKSPTSWIFMRLWEAVLAFTSGGYARIAHRKVSERFLRSMRVSTVKTWRMKDLAPDWDYSSAPELAHLELAHEAAHIGQDGDFIGYSIVDRVSQYTVDYFLGDLRETWILLRALDWVGKASQDERVTRCVSQCLATIHPSPTQNARLCDVPNSRALTLWSIITSWTHSRGLSGPHLPQWRIDTVAHADVSTPSVTRTRRLLGLTAEFSELFVAPTLYINPNFASANIDIPYNPMMFSYLTAELQMAVSAPSWIAHDKQPRRVCEIVTAMVHILFKYTVAPADVFNDEASLGGLSVILQGDLGPLISSRAPVLRALAFWLVSRHAGFKVLDGMKLEIFPGSAELSDFENLLTLYLEDDTNLQKCFEDDLYVIIIAGCRWLSLAKSEYDIALPKTDLIDLLQHALSASLSRGLQAHGFLSYWTDIEPWLDIIVPSTPDLPTAFSSSCRALLHVIQEYYVRGLISSEGAYLSAELHGSLVKIHEQNICAHPTCPWIDHECIGEWCCPLLELLELRAEDSNSPPDTHNIAIPDQTSGDAKSEKEETSIVATTSEQQPHTFWDRLASFGTQPLRVIDEESGVPSDDGVVSAEPAIPLSYIPSPGPHSFAQPASLLARRNAIKMGVATIVKNQVDDIQPDGSKGAGD